MKLKCSRNCIFSLELIAKWSSLFCLIPWYSFNKCCLIGKYIFKSYTVLFTCLILLLQLATTYVRLKHNFHRYNVITNILFIMTDINNLLFCKTSCLGTAFWKLSSWKRIFKLLHRLEKKCLHTNDKKANSVIFNTNFIFIIGNINISIMTIWYVINLNLSRVALFYMLLQYYLKFTFSSLIANIIIFIKYKFGYMNDIITNLYKEEGRDALLEIEETNHLFLVIDKIISEFNQIFGWPVMFLLADFILDLLNGFYMLVMNYFHEPFNEPEIKIIVFYIFASKVRTNIIFL